MLGLAMVVLAAPGPARAQGGGSGPPARMWEPLPPEAAPEAGSRAGEPGRSAPMVVLGLLALAGAAGLAAVAIRLPRAAGPARKAAAEPASAAPAGDGPGAAAHGLVAPAERPTEAALGRTPAAARAGVSATAGAAPPGVRRLPPPPPPPPAPAAAGALGAAPLPAFKSDVDEAPAAPARRSGRFARDHRRTPDPARTEAGGAAVQVETLAIEPSRVGRAGEFQLVAAGDDGASRVLARSPRFRVPALGPIPPQGEARAAHATLVAQVTVAGWRRVDAGGPWYETRFVRETSEPGRQRGLIRARRDGDRGRFEAVAVDEYGRPRPLAAPPPFSGGIDGNAARAAHRALIEQLGAEGWEPAGTLEAWYATILVRWPDR